MSYVQNTDMDRREMLDAVGAGSIEDLLGPVPEDLRVEGRLELGGPLSEAETAERIGRLASINRPASKMISFLGGGIYDRYIPATVRYVLSRSEFYTSYTPYQAEVSQGTLQAIFEYQTMIARLTGMEAANASMYDGATSLAEAVLMACGIRRCDRVLVPAALSPNYRSVIDSYAEGRKIAVESVPFTDGGRTDAAALGEMLSKKTAAVVLAQPNYLGMIEDAQGLAEKVHGAGAMLIALVDPVSLALIEPPGGYDADVVVGEGQSLGIPQGFGGPLLGFMATRKKYMRKCPGRLISMTTDVDGRRGFTMTLQTREQHIRREKATSNICTNEGLMALAATVYLSTVGESGFREVALQSASKARTLYRMMSEIEGVELPFGEDFFQEFVYVPPVPPGRLAEEAGERGILPGIPLGGDFPSLGENALLAAVTEKRTREDLELLCGVLSGEGGGG